MYQPPPGQSSNGNQPRAKRRHSDSSDGNESPSDTCLPTSVKPLSVQPIENEFEHLDEDADQGEEEDEQEDEPTAALKKQEYQDILNAQEYTTETSYGDIKITPFNLEEELEEGRFDVTGNYIFEKEKKDDENNDAWAESVDWDAVEKRAKEEEQRKKLAMQVEEDENETTGGASPQALDKIGSFKQMLRLMRPEETVQRTIKRLADAMPKRARPQKRSQSSSAKSTQTSQADQSKPTGDIVDARAKLDLMIELAHQRLEDGDVDIYQMSYEHLEEAINC